MRVLPRSLRLPRKEDPYFLSLIAVGALLMTVYVMFIGAAGHKASRADNSAEDFAPQWRRKSLEVFLLLLPPLLSRKLCPLCHRHFDLCTGFTPVEP